MERIGKAASALGDRDGFSAWRVRLDGVVAELDDVATDLRTALETWDRDPRRLEEVQARRRVLADLRRKHGGDLGDVLAFAASAEQRIAELSDAEGRLEALADRRDEEEAELRRQERELREARSSAALRLADAVGQHLRALAMPGASLRVEVSEEAAGDDVRFLLAANPGEPVPSRWPRWRRGASWPGRMLALRLVTPGGPPTMVFDEVDAGVGGEAALALAAGPPGGRRDERQVLVVTHLAQVAAVADHQVVVAKSLREGRTVTECFPVSDAERGGRARPHAVGPSRERDGPGARRRAPGPRPGRSTPSTSPGSARR